MRRVRAVLAALDMAAERRRAAALDRRHHLELAEADVAGVGAAPGRPVAAEDVRDLQSGTRHAAAATPAAAPSASVIGVSRSSGLMTVADRLGRDLGVERRRLELGVAEQHLDHADVDVLFQQMGGEAVPQRVRRHPLLDPGRRRPRHGQARLSWRVVIGSTGIAAGKQPARRPRATRHQSRSSPSSCGEQHGVAILAALALLDPDAACACCRCRGP